MTSSSTAPLRPGQQVRILTGMNGDRIGEVTYVDPITSTVHVRVLAPVLIAEPDGPHRWSTLPYGRRELEVLSEAV